MLQTLQELLAETNARRALAQVFIQQHELTAISVKHQLFLGRQCFPCHVKSYERIPVAIPANPRSILEKGWQIEFMTGIAVLESLFNIAVNCWDDGEQCALEKVKTVVSFL